LLKLLIVEDENKTREAIHSCMNWSELDIGEVREASNGVKALQMIEEYVPNLVITDIRMPEMDGIELVSRLKQDYPDTAVIIISAYSDMAYMKSAIKYHAVDYILKPVNVSELEQAVRISVERIRSNEKRQKALDLMEDNLILLREKWLRSIVNGETSSPAEWQRNRESFQMDYPDEYVFFTAAVRFVEMESFDSLLFRKTIQNQVQAIIHHHTKRYPFLYSFPNRDHEIVVVMGGPPAELTHEALSALYIEMSASIESHCFIKTEMYIGPKVSDLRELARSYDALAPIDDEPDGASRYSSTQDRDSKLVQSIKNQVAETYWNEALTVNDIAKGLSYTSAYICTIFKKSTGITLNNYINIYRINMSKQLLDDVSLRISDIAEMVGFNSENYFSKVFKKIEGITPSEYRGG